MKKNKQKTIPDDQTVLDLKSIINQNSQFFDKLIELIPARFYLPNDEDDKPWFQGLKKAERESAKRESKENIKKARRDRLDPEKSSTTTLALLKQRLEKEKSDEGSGGEEMDIKPMMSGLEGDDRSMTYEELRQRLHRRIEEFRATRNIVGGSNRERKRKERDEKRGYSEKKCKRDIETGGKKPAISNSAHEVEKDVAEATKELTFSHVKLGGEEDHGKKKSKLSKLKQLERAKQLEEAKKDPEKGSIVSKKHSWQTATSRAAGVKVHDDPKLLNRSIHKEKKKHQKNAQKWKERSETTEKMKAEKQQKRSKNISQRIQDKKMRRIAKREKKLMRPGFEGRKEGFINKGSA